MFGCLRMGETISQGPRRIAADRSIQTIWVWLLYDDAEVAENQQNTGIDGVRLTAKRPGYQNIPRSELSRVAK